MIKKVENTKQVKHIFNNCEDTIVWSCLQGIMGDIYVDDEKNPTSYMAILGDFIFFAGEPKEEIVLYKPNGCKGDFIIMVPTNDSWGECIEQCYKDKAKKICRYATKKESNIFDKKKLEQIVDTLPQDYEIKLIDEDIYYKCREQSWCRDLVSQYKDYNSYNNYGLGVAILKDGEVVSGASSYSRYEGGIEIEIDTNEKYRRKGLAYICGAKLILECLKRNLYPSWDAQNKWSLALAEKLGYHYSHTYNAYEIWGYTHNM